MKDRTPTYPGRVKLTPVSGQANTYDMVRADSPTQEGTPLNKDTLLKDTTAASLGLMGDPTVDEAFAKAANKFSELSAAIAAGTKIATGSYVGTGTYGSSNPCSLTFDFEPKLIIISGLGNKTLDYAKVYGFAIISGYGGFASITSGYMRGYIGVFASVNGNTCTWYSSSGYGSRPAFINVSSNQLYQGDGYNDFGQMNANGETYNYVAIG